MMGRVFLLSIAIFFVADVHIVAGQCDNVYAKVTSCLTGFQAVTDFSKGTFSAAKLKEYCTHFADSEVQCAENVAKRCEESSNFRELLSNITDINAFRNSADIVCDPNNTAALAEQESCLTRYTPEVQSCVVRVALAYRKQLHKKVLSGSSEAELLEETCGIYGEVKECQRPFGDNCGRDIQVIFDALNHGNTPPACVAIATGDVDRHCDSLGTEVGTCLSGYRTVTNFTKGEWSAADIGEYCTNKVESEVQCVENAVKRCQQVDSDFREIVDKVIGVDVYRSSMNIVCDPNNIAVLAEKQDCVDRYAPAVQSCARGAGAPYLDKARWSQRKDEMYDTICVFMRDVKECQEKLGDKCGKDMQILFDAMNQAITPPVCSGAARSGNILVLMSFAFLAFFKERW